MRMRALTTALPAGTNTSLSEWLLVASPSCAATSVRFMFSSDVCAQVLQCTTAAAFERPAEQQRLQQDV